MAGLTPFQFSSKKRQDAVSLGFMNTPIAGDIVTDLLGWFEMWINPDSVKRSRTYKQSVNHTAGSIVTFHYRPENSILSCTGKCGWVKTKSIVEITKANALNNLLAGSASLTQPNKKEVDKRKHFLQNDTAANNRQINQNTSDNTIAQKDIDIAKGMILDSQTIIDSDKIKYAELSNIQPRTNDISLQMSLLLNEINLNLNIIKQQHMVVSDNQAAIDTRNKQIASLNQKNTENAAEEKSLSKTNTISQAQNNSNLSKVVASAAKGDIKGLFQTPWNTSNSHSNNFDNSPLVFLNRLKSIANEPMYYIDTEGIEHYNIKYIKLFTKEYQDGVIYEGYFNRFDVDEQVDYGETVGYSYEFVIENETPVTLVQRVLGAYAGFGSAIGDITAIVSGT
jgi:hypothetical protein